MSHPIVVAITTVSILASAAAVKGQTKPSTSAGTAPLPRTKFIADMDVEFRKMDADKDGQLTRTEIEQYQELQAVTQAQSRNRELFAQLDADKNGQLSKAEFAKIATPPSAASAQPMLARMDSNRDQQISLIEHRTATLANFDRIDADKDGVVTPDEMKAGGVNPR